MANLAGRARVKRAVDARMREMGLNNTDLAERCDNKPDAGSIGEFRTTPRWFSTRNLGRVQRALGWTDEYLAALLTGDPLPDLHESDQEHDERRVADLPPDVTEQERLELLDYLEFIRRHRPPE